MGSPSKPGREPGASLPTIGSSSTQQAGDQPGSTKAESIPRLGAALAFAVLVAAAIRYVLLELHRNTGVYQFDVYGYFLPNKIHAIESIHWGGRGLLWNPYQSCGEPFFANPAMALLYPLHVLFLILEPNLATHAVLILNMIIGGTGMFFLVRKLGVGWIGALVGALAFELGPPMSELTSWSPLQNGPWTWVPWALLFCERLLREPTSRSAILLGLVLSLEFLAGWVLITTLTYQLIALRVAWELLTRPEGRPWRSVVFIAAGLAIAPLLAAVQVLPAAELAGESFRINVEVEEFLGIGGMTLAKILAGAASRRPPLPFTAVLIPLALIAPFISVNCRLAVFYLLVGCIYGVLGLGHATPFYDLYTMLPPGAATVRYAHRLFWIPGLCLTILASLGVDSLCRDPGVATRHARFAFFAVGTAAVCAVAPEGLWVAEALALIALTVVVLLSTVAPDTRRWAIWIGVGAIALNLIAVPIRYPSRLIWSTGGYRHYKQIFSGVQQLATPQDRIFQIPSLKAQLGLQFMQKTATLMELKATYDYDALLGKRLVDYDAAIWTGSPYTRVAENVAAGNLSRRLLDVAAVRYVIVSDTAPVTERGLDFPAIKEIGLEPLVLRNDTALPRARYVPRIQLISKPRMLLDHLAHGSDDLSEIAFVEELLAGGFTGGNASSKDAMTVFTKDDPEHLQIEVRAPERGFLMLAEHHYPGWIATVNGKHVPIQRANYMFQLVEVPAGDSVVEFRFRPRSLIVGAAISAVSLVLVLILLLRSRKRPD